MIQRGWNKLDKVIDEKQKMFIASCVSCVFNWDKEEWGCTNPNVLPEFDIIKRDDGTKYCNYWSCSRKSKKEDF